MEQLVNVLKSSSSISCSVSRNKSRKQLLPKYRTPENQPQGKEQLTAELQRLKGALCPDRHAELLPAAAAGKQAELLRHCSHCNQLELKH